jgi:hypothetical protein
MDRLTRSCERNLAQSARSNPTAFQAVSFQHGFVDQAWGESIGRNMSKAERHREGRMASAIDPTRSAKNDMLAAARGLRSARASTLEPALHPGVLQAASAASRLSVVVQPTGFSR